MGIAANRGGKAVLVVALAVFAAGCGEKPPAGRAAPHPLPVRAEPKKPIDLSKPPAADNSRCYVCHLNLEEETLVRSHAYADVKCEKCHGVSDAHCGDEGHTTAPDILYSPETITFMCLDCHPQVRPKKDFKPPVEADAKKGCLDPSCHFNHKLEQRRVHWDKVTRKRIEE